MSRGDVSDLAQALAYSGGQQVTTEAQGAEGGPEGPLGLSFGEAVAILRRLAKGLDYEADPRRAAQLLQERMAARQDAEQLQTALLELGARLLLHRLTRADV